MPITGRFIADFSDFQSAVQKADVSLKGMETGANKVSTSLNKMVDSFSGRKIIQEAELMGQTFQLLASKGIGLTTSELQRMGTVASEAIAKLKAAGTDIPPGIQKIADAAKAAAENTSKMAAPAAAAGLSFKTLFSSFTAAGLATQAISKLTTEVTRMVDAGMRLPAIEQGFKRLNASVGQNSQEMLGSLQTATKGMVSELDLMQSANKALLLGLPVTKASMGELATAATALGRAMGMDATKSLDDLITALGRSSPMILDNLGLTVKVGEANEAYAAKLGKTAEQLTDAEKKTAFYEAAMEAARKKTKELGDQSKTLGEIITTVWTSISNSVTRGVGEFNVGVGRMLSSWAKFRQAIEASQGSGLGGAILAAAAQEMAATEEAIQKARKAARTDINLAVDVSPLIAYQKELEAIRAAVSKLTPEQKSLITESQKFGKSTEEVAKALNVSKNTVEAYVKSLQASETANKKSAVAEKAHWEEVAKASAIRSKATRDEEQAIEDLNFDMKILVSNRLTDLGDQSKKVLSDSLDLWIKNSIAIESSTEAARDLVQVFSTDTLTGRLDKITEHFDDQRQAITLAQRTAINYTERITALTNEEIAARKRATDEWVRGGERTRTELAVIAKDAQTRFEAMRDSGVFTAAALQRAWEQWQEALRDANAEADKHVRILKDLLDAVDIIADALGQINPALGSAIGGIGNLVSKSADAVSAAKAAQAAQAAGMAGATVSMASIATGIGVVIVGVKILKGLFEHFGVGGMSNAEAALAKVKKATLEANGGVHALRLTFAQAGIDIDKVFNEKTAVGFTREMARANRVVQEMGDRLQRLGLTWHDLGQSVKQLTVDTISRVLIEDFRKLTIQGIDADKVIKGMSGSLSQLVIDAVKTGTKIPGALKPIIEQLIKMGGLTDAAARAMLGLADDSMPALADIKEAAERYGLTLDQLGPKVKQLEITETAQQIVKDFKLLMLAGADVGTVMGAMKDHVQKLVTAALKAGLELPESMRPLIQQMIDAGLLTDDTGKKLTDMGNLQFAKPLSERFDELIAKLSDLIDALSKVGTAAEEGFGRARGAAEALGRAIPRGSVPGAPEPGTGTPGAPAVPRPEGPGGPPSNQDDNARTRDDAPGTPPGAPGRRNPNPSTADIAAMMASAQMPAFADSQSLGRVLPFPSPALTPAEAALTASRSAEGSQAAGSTMTIILEQDGQKSAEFIVPYIPDAVKRYGLA